MSIATFVSILISFNALHMDDAKQAPKVEKTILIANSQAPALTADTWVKGEEVKALDPDKVYVIEFWATWCVPCLKTIPNLTKLQKENPKDLVVIGVAASEKPQKKKETSTPSKDKPADKSTDPTDTKAMEEEMLANVKTFVTQQGDKMDYRVVFDGDGSMSREWMQAAKQRTIPTAFIIAKGGKIAWIGPANQIEKPLAIALGNTIPRSEKKKSAKVPGGVRGASAAGETPAPPKKAVD